MDSLQGLLGELQEAGEQVEAAIEAVEAVEYVDDDNLSEREEALEAAAEEVLEWIGSGINVFRALQEAGAEVFLPEDRMLLYPVEGSEGAFEQKQATVLDEALIIRMANAPTVLRHMERLAADMKHVLEVVGKPGGDERVG